MTLSERKKQLSGVLKKLKEYETRLSHIPVPEYTASKLRMHPDKTKKIYKELEKMGVIELRGKTWHSKEVQKPIKKTRQVKTVKKHSKKNIFFKISLLLVSSSCALASVFFSFDFIDNFMTPWQAFILAFVNVLYITIFIELSCILKNNKKILAFVFCIIVGLLLVFLSMFATVAAGYEKNVIETAENLTIKKNTGLLETYEKQETELESLKQVYTKQMLSNQKKRDNVTTKDQGYWAYNWQVTQAQKKIDSITSGIKTVRNNILDIKKDVSYGKKEKISVTNWLQNIFKIDYNILDFIIYSVFACFIDIVSPFCLYCAFLLRTKNKVSRKIK